MKLIKIAGASLNQIPLAWEHNYQNISKAIAEAKKQQIGLLVLPELCLTGYGCEDAFLSPGMHKTALDMLCRLLPQTHGIAVSVGLPLMFENRVFNTAALLANGQILGFVGKQFLAGDGIHYEPRWFTEWPANHHTTIDLRDTHPEIADKLTHCEYPLGDIYFKLGGVKIGFEICEDAWVPNRPGRKLATFGTDIILNPSASHFAFDKLQTRKRLAIDASRAFGTAYIYTNLVGNEAGRAIYDGGTLIAANGHLLNIAERLTFADVQLTSAVIDLEDLRLRQSQTNTAYKSMAPTENLVIKPFSYPEAKAKASITEDKPWENSPFIKEEEFARALALALYDYLRKSRSKGFVISLSGGADSSSIVACCYLMVALGTRSIGFDAFKEKLAYIPKIDDCQTVEEMVGLLLFTAYQPTENSGDITFEAAQTLAKAVNAQFFVFDVNQMYKDYVHTIAKAIGRDISWETDDIALQNIQSRVRAPSVWMLANIKGALLLSTSNRSEAAVGYATMDGDTSGGLSPIAGIDKAFLRKWLVWLEKEGVDGQIKIPALNLVNIQQPTAELRPKDAKQTDEADLMPYDLLDDIEEAAIRDKKTPLECFQILQVKYPQHNSRQLREWITKFFRLWSRNQWKRERYAPSFHLDDENLDPKTWCRFPILSGGFDYEIKQLEAYEG